MLLELRMTEERIFQLTRETLSLSPRSAGHICSTVWPANMTGNQKWLSSHTTANNETDGLSTQKKNYKPLIPLMTDDLEMTSFLPLRPPSFGHSLPGIWQQCYNTEWKKETKLQGLKWYWCEVLWARSPSCANQHKHLGFQLFCIYHDTTKGHHSILHQFSNAPNTMHITTVKSMKYKYQPRIFKICYTHMERHTNTETNINNNVISNSYSKTRHTKVVVCTGQIYLHSTQLRNCHAQSHAGQ